MSRVTDDSQRIRSAVLVDVDNMFLGLQAISPAAAAVFVTDPGRWVRWLVDLSYPQVGEKPERDPLVRACYLNPNLGGSWRSAFVQAGFQVVDCPTLTQAGKNSADIHMVIAMLDLLAHPTHFDEIIIMSSDADFTPALLRLRAHDRRTVAVTSGRHAPVLQASCDHLVPASAFVRDALVDSSLEPARPPPARSSPVVAAVVTASAATAPAKKAAAKKIAAQPVVAKTAAKKVAMRPAVTKVAVKQAGSAGAAKKAAKKVAAATAVGLPNDVRARTSDEVRRRVSASDVPVVLGKLAEPVRSALGPDLAPSWDGAKGLKKLLQQLRLSELRVSDGTPGYIYDPSRHRAP